MKIEMNQAPPTHFDFMIFWRGLPFFFKTLVLFSYVLALVGMFTDLLLECFANYPVMSLQKLQFWRVLSAPYVSLGMLHYCIGMINLYYLMPNLEKTYSTAFIIVDFFTQNILLQFVFTMLVNIIHDFTPTVESTYSCSLWSILIIYLVRVCHAEDKPIQICCMPFKLRSRYYPLLMIVFFNIFTLPVLQFDVYLAYILALLQVKLCGGTLVICSASCLKFVENRLLTIFGSRGDIYLLENSSFKEYEQNVKHSIFRERKLSKASEEQMVKDLNELHPHSQFETRPEEKFIESHNNSV